MKHPHHPKQQNRDVTDDTKRTTSGRNIDSRIRMPAASRSRFWPIDTPTHHRLTTPHTWNCDVQTSCAFARPNIPVTATLVLLRYHIEVVETELGRNDAHKNEYCNTHAIRHQTVRRGMSGEFR